MGINKQIWMLIRQVKSELIVKITLILLLSASHIVQAIAMARTINILFYEESMDKMIWYIVIAFAAVCTGAVITYILEFYNVKIGAKMKTKILGYRKRKYSDRRTRYQGIKT